MARNSTSAASHGSHMGHHEHMGAKPYQDADEIDVELFKVGDGSDVEDSQ